MSEDEISKLLKNHRRSSKFVYILEACGSLGLYTIHKQIFKTLLPSEKNTPLLGKIWKNANAMFWNQHKVMSYITGILPSSYFNEVQCGFGTLNNGSGTAKRSIDFLYILPENYRFPRQWLLHHRFLIVLY